MPIVRFITFHQDNVIAIISVGPDIISFVSILTEWPAVIELKMINTAHKN